MKCANPGCPNDVPAEARRDARFCRPACRVAAARAMKASLATASFVPLATVQKATEALAPCRIERTTTKEGTKVNLALKVSGFFAVGSGSTLPEAYRDALSRVKVATFDVDRSQPQTKPTKKK